MTDTSYSISFQVTGMYDLHTQSSLEYSYLRIVKAPQCIASPVSSQEYMIPAGVIDAIK